MPEAKLDVIVDPSGAITGSSRAKQAINSINDSTRKMVAEMEKAKQAQERINAATQRMVGAIRAAGTAWLVYKGIMNTYIRNSIEAERVETQLNAVLKSTRHAAGLTAIELKNMASEMQMLTAFGDEEVLSMQNLLLTFKNIKGDEFKRATMAVLDLSTAMGQDLKSSAIQVGKALNDPKIGLTALQRVGITFSDSQKKLIKDLTETGRVAEAQRIIFKELESQFGGSAKAATNNLGGAIQQLKNKFGDLFEINATGEFGEMTTAVKELTIALDTQAVKDFAQEIGKLIAGGITKATEGLQLMAENVDTLKTAFGGLMAMKVGSWFGGLHGALIGGASYVLGKGAYDFIKKDQEQAKIAMKYIGGYSMTSSAGESYGDMFAAEKAALLGEKIKAPVVPTAIGGGTATGKSGGKTAAEEALERIKLKAQEAGIEIAAALSRLDAQNAAMQEAKDAATEGVSKYYESLRWENQQGLLGDTEYLDALKRQFSELGTELETLGIDIQNVSNWSEPMRQVFSEIQSVAGGLATDTMDLLQKQFESGTMTNAQYLSALEAIKTKFAEYPAVVKMAQEAIDAFNLSAQASLPTVAGQVQSAWEDMNMAIAQAPSAIGDAFVSAIRGAENLGDAMRNLLQDIGAVIAKALIMKYIVGPIMGFADGGIVGSVGTPASAVGLDNWVGAKSIFGRGGVFNSGQLTAFASGGIVNKPTLFPFASGIGLMGERGPEAIMPLKRTSSGDLGVQAEGGGGTNITMNINAVDSKSFVEMMRTNRASVESIIVENIMRNGAVRGAIRGMA
jgi:phage-related minor tail protein